MSWTTGPQVSAPLRHGEELLELTAPVTAVSDAEEAVVGAELALPSVEIHRLPCGSKATLSGQEIGLTWSFGKPREVGVRVLRVAADQQQPPAERRARRVAPALGELQDLAVLVGVARVRLVAPWPCRRCRGRCCWSART